MNENVSRLTEFLILVLWTSVVLHHSTFIV